MILFGASGHAKVIIDILKSNSVKVEKIIDDHPASTELFGIPVEKNQNNYGAVSAIISIGNNSVRKLISEKFHFTYSKAIHPSAVVSAFSEIAEGTVVMAGAVINPDSKVGKHCIVNTAAVIEHDCILEDFVHVSPNAALAGNVLVGEGAHVGIGASVKQGVKIGKWATVGAGAVIIRDVPNFATVVGNPGKVITVKNDTI